MVFNRYRGVRWLFNFSPPLKMLQSSRRYIHRGCRDTATQQGRCAVGWAARRACMESRGLLKGKGKGKGIASEVLKAQLCVSLILHQYKTVPLIVQYAALWSIKGTFGNGSINNLLPDTLFITWHQVGNNSACRRSVGGFPVARTWLISNSLA